LYKFFRFVQHMFVEIYASSDLFSRRLIAALAFDRRALALLRGERTALNTIARIAAPPSDRARADARCATLEWHLRRATPPIQ
jgi:hypothetical protein